jgi:hypothetical protein
MINFLVFKIPANQKRDRKFLLSDWPIFARKLNLLKNGTFFQND